MSAVTTAVANIAPYKYGSDSCTLGVMSTALPAL